jgi:hypothetical protein
MSTHGRKFRRRSALLTGLAGRALWVTAVVVALLWVSAFFVLRSGRDTTELPWSCAALASDEAGSPFAGALGVNLDETELVEPALTRALELLEQNGVRWVRFTLPWDQLEPESGVFDWSWSDRVFAALAQHPGIRPLVVLDRSPEWARAETDKGNPMAPPHERSGFGDFAAAVAERYRSQVRYYQVWNEPNIAPHWGARPADPADYLGLLREAAVQIRGADSDAVIVLAGLAPTTEGGGANLSDLSYLDALYGLNARPWFDIVAAHPFGFSQLAAAPAGASSLNFGRASLLHLLMTRHGDFCTPVWGTAYGWNSLPPGFAGAASPWGLVNEAEQADNARAAVEASARRDAWLGPLFWAALCPDRPADDPWNGFALCAEGSDLSSGAFVPRPAWPALLEAARQPAVLPPGDHRMNHPALHYQGNWRVTPDAADPGKDGDTLSFDFQGTDLALRVQGGPYWAVYRVWLDGGPANALPRDESGISYMVLHDPLAEIRSIPVATGLPQGQHRVRMEATGGWGQWALQGVSIRDSAPVAGWPGWLLLGLAALGTVFCGWLMASQRRATHAADTAPEKPSPVAMGKQPGWLDRVALRANGWLWLFAIGLLLVLAVSPRLILDLAAIAGLGLLFLVRPDLSLPLIAASIPFWFRPEHLLRWEFSIFEILLWLAVAALLARWVLAFLFHASRITFHVRGLDWPVLAVLALGLVSALFAGRANVAFREYRTVFLGGVLFYWLVTRVPRPAGGRFSPWPLLNGLIAGAAIASIAAIGQLITGQGRVDVEGVWRVRAFYGSPNNLALMLDRIIPLALAIAAFGGVAVPRAGPSARADEKVTVGVEPLGGLIAGPERSAKASSPDQRVIDFGAEGSLTGNGPGRNTLRWLYGLAALVMAMACVATFSKGALLLGLPAGVGLVLVAGAWRARRRWPLTLLGGLLASWLAGMALLARTPRFADLWNFTTGTSFYRLKLWQGALRMALDHPWLGVGPDNFLYAYRTRYVLPSAWQELSLSHPHNIVLDLWTRLGIPGLAVGIWAIASGAWRAWRLFNHPDPWIWPIALGLLGGLAATVAHGLIDNSLFLVDLMAIFMLSLGLLQRLATEPSG